MSKRIDPRTKIIISLVLSIMGIAISNILYLLYLTVFTILLLFVFNVNFNGFFKRFSPYLKILLFIAIIQSLFNFEGEALITIGSLRLLTVNGLLNAGMFMLRVFIIFSTALIISSSDMRTSLQGLLQWHIPYEIAFAVLISIKYIPILRDEFSDRIVSIQLRGVNFKKLAIGKRIKVYTSLLLPTLSGSIIKAKKLALSLEARGFKCQKKRTSYFLLKLKWYDYFIMLLFLSIGAILLCVYYT